MILPYNSDSWRIRTGAIDYRYDSTLNHANLSYLQRPALNTPYNSNVYPIGAVGPNTSAGQIPALNTPPYAGIVNWRWLFGPAPAIRNNPPAIPYGPNPLGLFGNIIG